MKNLILIIFLLHFINGKAQSGFATYKIQITFDEETLKIDKKYGLLQNAIDVSNEMEYELLFKNKESNFYQKTDKNLDKISVNTANVIADVPKITYQNIDSKNILYKFDENEIIFKNDEFIIQETNNLKWEITNETKQIDSYLCYKATTLKTTIKNNKEYYETIIAWFCPELPYSFGPAKYAGLPGLILEIQEKNIYFMLKKLSINTEQNIDIIIPKAKKTITQNEYYKIINERMDALRLMTEEK